MAWNGIGQKDSTPHAESILGNFMFELAAQLIAHACDTPVA